MALPKAFYNGYILPLEDIKISPLDLGVQRGYSVFDFFKLKKGENPWFEWYMDRLEHSASAVQIKLSHSRNELKEICNNVLNENGLDAGCTKIILSAGDSIDGYTKRSKSSTLILGYPIRRPEETYYTSGAHLILHRYIRDLPHVKSTNYMVSAMLAPKMKDEGAMDVLYHDGNYISECSRCSFFIVHGNEIITSKNNTLNGITRKRLLSDPLFKEQITRRDIMMSELEQADEAFITSTSKGVMPIVQIGTQQIGNGRVGHLTKKCMESIAKF